MTKTFQPDAFQEWAPHDVIDIDRSVKGWSDLCSYQGYESWIVQDVREQPECAFGCVCIDPGLFSKASTVMRIRTPSRRS